MAPYRTALTIVVLALLAPFLYDRSQVLVGFYKNNPIRLSKVNALGQQDIKFADKIRSCEDAIIIESAGVAILPCDAGRERWNTVMGFFVPGPVPRGELYLYDYKNAAAPDSESLKRLEVIDYAPGDDYHSLGVAFDEPTSTLFVANHRHDGPRVDLFKLDLAALKATHIRSVAHPLIHGPNAITLRNSNEFFVTNDHHFTWAQSRFLTQAETYLALPLGTVVHVDISDPDTTKATVVARVPFANGIELVNKTTVAVASSSKAQVNLYSIVDGEQSGSAPALTYSSAIKLPYHVDNLSLTSDGRLLMAGHPHLPSLTKYAASRWICNDATELAKADGTMKEYCATGQAASGASEWTEAGGLRHLYIDTEYPTSASVNYDPDRKVGIITGLYAKGILVWRD
ncbi:hypothetical protein PFICI_02441 [Pestalotiopsis fici W106-1]|uniref:SMP-30/Gluconolactonase/LRE-like region domain-containing protein n=1 Tax=Pestalotiopsis fici (strain W106-1 / CGMCC3.15140) TaxID=1229662 RepID=W3XGS0_PESFW|nr:uncharacterized protein PFICI_02441 [Pestalotiopsis fici W106-1]ETS84416.1 hypothetical protein PFICI_02441 [Pestalotiopsis fici W106-1]